ncbi:type IV pilus assembly protein FimV [Acinetobacter johnsonii]|uniref:type IV pilus assembly protein FimV n=2 Tax=Pseudomonadota TaxID=1224 RepID=UPI00244A14E4|nr:hypothetical protein [Acinetobacter johnsonii]MDH1799993.1 hypothetical protein [Acinetobacter johnsonii]
MTVNNKLKIAILAIIASQNVNAITINPIQIQSAPGELLYAELNFHDADPNAPIQASLASAEDLMSLGVMHQPPSNLNFFTRRTSASTGVITITSSRPLTEAELNIVVKIKEGNAARLQHIKTANKRSAALQTRTNNNEKALKPVVIVNEKDIALNLPVSTQFNSLKTTATPASNTTPLKLSNHTPPSMSATAITAPTQVISVASTQIAAAAQTAAPRVESITQAKKSADPLVQKYADSVQKYADSVQKSDTPISAQANPQATPSTAKTTPAAPATTARQAAPKSAHVVRSNESLWGIASRIAAEENRPVGEVMQQIKAKNEHAFIQGDINRLRRGANLNLTGLQTAKSEQKVSVSSLPKQSSQQSGKAKYRLNQAEMSLVAEKEQDSSHGSAKKSTEKNQTSNELSLKVMTSREKTVKLQRNVTQLEVALNQKDQRIQLLNARLAQLQQQLKAQQTEKKPTH